MERRFQRKSAPVVSEAGNLTGRAIAYDQWTMIGKAPYGFREKVNPLALRKTMKDGDMVLLDNHDTAKPLARQSAGTLILRDTKSGLDWDTENLADTTYAQDAVKNARAGNFGGCSFGFDIVRDKWDVGDDGVEEREILEAKVPEISVCTFPAYGQTSVSARSQIDAALEARERFYAAKGETPPDRAELPDTRDDVADGLILGAGPEMEKVLIALYNALPADKREAFIQERAAKATYSDVNTCGDCGATSQYGNYCTDCGNSMDADASDTKYCSSCGSKKKPAKRSDPDHEHDEKRNEPVTATRDDEGRKMRLRMLEADLSLED